MLDRRVVAELRLDMLGRPVLGVRAHLWSRRVEGWLISGGVRLWAGCWGVWVVLGDTCALYDASKRV